MPQHTLDPPPFPVSSPPRFGHQARPRARGSLGLIGAAAIAFALSGVTSVVFDRPLGQWLDTLEPWNRPEAVWISSAAITLPVVVLTAAALVLAMSVIVRMFLGPVEGIERARYGAAYLLTAAGASLVTVPMKHLIGRARPLVMNDPFLFQPLTFQDAMAAFPSGQAALAGALATALSAMIPRFRPAFWIAGLAICGSRVLAGEHWLSDVAAGWSVGMVAALLLARVFVGARPAV